MYPHIFSQISKDVFSHSVWEFHRTLLPQRLQVVYDFLKEAIEKRIDAVDVSNFHINLEDSRRVSEAVHYDYSIFFDYSVSYWHIGEHVTSIDISYQFSDDKYHWYVKKCIEKMWEIYCELGLSNESAEYMVVKILHDYLTRNIVWHKTADELRDHSIVGALLNGHGVCDSIAHTVSFLLNAFGVKCTCISGKDFSNDNDELSERNMLHAWNVVEIESHRGHLDIGFDFNHQDRTKPLYNYFMISDEDCKVTRTWDVQTDCDGEYSYFIQYGLLANSNKIFEQILRGEIEDGMHDIYIKTWKESTKQELFKSCAQVLSSVYGERVYYMTTPVKFDERRKIFTLRIMEDDNL